MPHGKPGLVPAPFSYVEASKSPESRSIVSTALKPPNEPLLTVADTKK